MSVEAAYTSEDGTLTCSLTYEPLDVARVTEWVGADEAGALGLFIGAHSYHLFLLVRIDFFLLIHTPILLVQLFSTRSELTMDLAARYDAKLIPRQESEAPGIRSVF